MMPHIFLNAIELEVIHENHFWKLNVVFNSSFVLLYKSRRALITMKI